MEQAPIATWGAILRTIPLHILYKYPYLPVVHSVWQGDTYGSLDVTMLTKYPPLREGSDGKSSLFLQYLLQVYRYSRWGIPSLASQTHFHKRGSGSGLRDSGIPLIGA